MAPVATAVERRRQRRYPGAGPHWRSSAVLRPGQSITFVNASRSAALVESGSQLRPGSRAEVQLAGPSARTLIRGQVDCCRVVALEPLTYRGVIVFEQPFDLGEDDMSE